MQIIADNWEQRKSRKLLYKLFIIAFIIPFLTFLSAYSYSYFFKIKLTYKIIKQIVLGCWLITMLILFIIAWRSSRERLLYNQETTANLE